MTLDPKTATYTRIPSLGDTYKVVDRAGEVSTMSMHAYGCFLAGLRQHAGDLSLFDEITGQWMVGTIEQLIESPGNGWPERLRVLRGRMDMTQAEMAKMLGYGAASRIAELEAGKATITPMLERLICAYEVVHR
jgi:DNA-binding XRE family transcriptional regulator